VVQIRRKRVGNAVGEKYDLAIIGAGSAGITAARFTNRLGKRVALIEANRVGGDCTWTGCVPSKSLLHAASVANTVRSASHAGITVSPPTIDFAAVMARIRDVIGQIYSSESPDALRAEGIDVVEGHAEFTGDRSIAAAGRSISAKSFLICTGASPFVPPIAGLENTPFLTYESFWQLDALPARLIVIGGGPIGCEISQACQRLGSQVTLVEALDRILPNDDTDAARLVEAALIADGVDVRLSAPVESVRLIDKEFCVTVAGGVNIMGDAVLVAVGPRPNVSGMNLDAAGVKHSPSGIAVDAFLRTTARGIYAAGDCVGDFQFTHYAGFQAAIAVRNALLPGKSRARPERVPWATFTDPEVAQAGHTEAQARDAFGGKVRTTILEMAQIDRAVIDDTTTGFIKVTHRANGKVLGATVVGPRAAEVVQEWTMAIDQGMSLSDVLKSIHPYPSLATGNQQIAWESYLSGITSGFRGKLLWLVSR
jgi:pyruvate/2-oxoglutarate dehydrogenase complex dihydrolipoamide dehydrogenase (E3) component